MSIQQDRLKKVLEALKNRGITQKDIAIAINTDEVQLSQLKSGKIKNVPDAFINKLEEAYSINPYYISGESEIMIIPHIKKLQHFDQVVESWDTVKSSKKNYLRLEMDKNFYDFLLNVDKARLAVEDGISSEDAEIKNLSRVYTGKPDVQEFVLLPNNVLMSILSDTKEKRKTLEEVLDLFGYVDYSETDDE